MTNPRGTRWFLCTKCVILQSWAPRRPLRRRSTRFSWRSSIADGILCFGPLSYFLVHHDGSATYSSVQGKDGGGRSDSALGGRDLRGTIHAGRGCAPQVYCPTHRR